VEQSYKLGVAAVKLAIAGRNAVMPVIERVSNKPYRWRIGVANLADIANKEKMMPRISSPRTASISRPDAAPIFLR